MNRHLNLFHFFNGNDGQYYEDNLSRAFSICLQNDPVFLDHVLKAVLDQELYDRHFNIDYRLFRGNPSFEWKDNLVGYPLEAEPYMKFCHFNRGVCWVLPDEKQAEQTHCSSFFHEFNGKWNRDKWNQFDQKLEGIIPGWKAQENGWGLTFQQAFEQSDRGYFTVSSGFALTVKIPYEKAKRLDSAGEKSSLSDEIRKIIDGFERIV